MSLSSVDPVAQSNRARCRHVEDVRLVHPPIELSGHLMLRRRVDHSLDAQHNVHEQET